MTVEFEAVVGAHSVLDQPGVLAEYSRDHSYVQGQRPALVVQPGSSNEIERLVSLARRRGYKLIPVSSGTPRFRGDTVPSVEGAVMVDLSRMNRILWVDRRNRVAVVEPGVTFEGLEGALEAQGLRGMMPLLPRRSKSVVGAFLEREPFTVPKYAWDLGDPVASSEMILGDGYRMRTGGGAGPLPTLEEQRKVGGAHKLPLSPFTMDTRRIVQGSQGSMAICTWLSLRCELLPEHERVFFVASDNLERLGNAARRFLYLRLTDEQYLLNSLSLACLVEKSPERIERIRADLPPWVLVTSIAGYGTLADEQFAYKEEDLRTEVAKLGMALRDDLGGISEKAYRETVLRKASEEPYWKLRYRGDCREVFFLTTLSRAPEFVAAARELAERAGFDPESMGIYVQQVIQGTACHCALDLFMDEKDAARFEAFYTDLSRRIFEMGGYFSRPYGVWSDLVYPGCETFVKYARGMKAILDPDLVMNPGKLCFRGMANES